MASRSFEIVLGRHYLTVGEFYRRVAATAYRLFKEREYRDQLRDWQYAQSMLARELGRFPTHDETKKRAQDTYESQKQRRATADWLEATNIVGRRYAMLGGEWIREKAWFLSKSRRRSGHAGTPEEDWLRAEQDLLQRLNS